MAAQHSWCRMQPPACTHAQARARAPVLEGAVNLLALASLHPHTAHGHALRVKPACGCVWLRVVACETGRLPHAAARVVAACVGRGAGGRGGGGGAAAAGGGPAPPRPPPPPPPPPPRAPAPWQEQARAHGTPSQGSAACAPSTQHGHVTRTHTYPCARLLAHRCRKPHDSPFMHMPLSQNAHTVWR
jgi:hypothetical protein